MDYHQGACICNKHLVIYIYNAANLYHGCRLLIWATSYSDCFSCCILNFFKVDFTLRCKGYTFTSSLFSEVRYLFAAVSLRREEGSQEKATCKARFSLTGSTQKFFFIEY